MNSTKIEIERKKPHTVFVHSNGIDLNSDSQTYSTVASFCQIKPCKSHEYK